MTDPEPSTAIFQSPVPVTLLGGGPVTAAQIAAALAVAPEVVAADGGADHPLPRGHPLRLVVGDMDSVADPAALRACGVPLHHITEQDTTDLEKCLRSVAAPLLIGLGFLGGRLDHELAALNALVKHRGTPLLLLGAEDICFACPDTFSIDLPAGVRFSLFPMARVTGTCSEGLRWPVEGLVLDPAGRVGTSNVTTGGRVRIGFAPAHMLVILPARYLPRVAQVLGEAAVTRPDGAS